MMDRSEIGPEEQFRTFLAEGKFMIQRSRSTGQYVFYPRLSIPGSGETDLEWVEAAGTGTVYSITVNRKRAGSYNVALIELSEGVRMMSRIPSVETLPIGSPVVAYIEELNEQPTVLFRPADAEKINA